MRSRRRPGPLVRSRHKLRDGRPAAQSRPVQWPQAAEEYTGGTFFCLWFVLARTPVANVELLSCKLIFFRGRRSIPDFGKRRSCPCRRAPRSVFAILPRHPSGASLPLASLCAVRATRPLRADSIGSCVPGQQASGSRPLGSASRTRCRAPRRPSELHAMRQELPSHSRLPVCRPCDSALACRQYRLWCAWSASFGKLSPWQ